MPYNNIHTLFRRNIFGDGSNRRPLPQPPILLMVKTKTNSSFTVKVAERSNRSFSAELMNYLFQTSALFNMWQCNEQNLIDCIYDCVCLTKWYQYIFSVSVKFGPYYITGQWGEFIEKMLLNAFIYFFGIFFFCFLFVFHYKICVFIIFISFFWWSIKFPQQNINQSKTWIDGHSLSAELYETYEKGQKQPGFYFNQLLYWFG